MATTFKKGDICLYDGYYVVVDEIDGNNVVGKYIEGAYEGQTINVAASQVRLIQEATDRIDFRVGDFVQVKDGNLTGEITKLSEFFLHVKWENGKEDKQYRWACTLFKRGIVGPPPTRFQQLAASEYVRCDEKANEMDKIAVVVRNHLENLNKLADQIKDSNAVITALGCDESEAFQEAMRQGITERIDAKKPAKGFPAWRASTLLEELVPPEFS